MNQISIPWLSDYILGWYKIAYGIGGALALIVILIGGFLYATSMGNPQQISKGKDLITGAITGLVLILSTYLILSVIDGRLTNLQPIKVKMVNIAAPEPLEKKYPTTPCNPQNRPACEDSFDEGFISYRYSNCKQSSDTYCCCCNVELKIGESSKSGWGCADTPTEIRNKLGWIK